MSHPRVIPPENDVGSRHRRFLVNYDVTIIMTLFGILVIRDITQQKKTIEQRAMEHKLEYHLPKSMPSSELRKLNVDKLLSCDFTDIPSRWKQTLPADFRPLQWVYPRVLGARPLGYFESVLHDYNTRSRKIFLWREGDKYIQVVPRPVDLLPAEPLPWESLDKNMNGGISSKRKRRVSYKRSVNDLATATWIHYRQHQVLKISYSGTNKTPSEPDADISTTNIVIDHRNSCGSSDESYHSVSPVITSSPSPDSSADILEELPNRNDLPDLTEIQLTMVPHRQVTVSKDVIGQGLFGAIRTAHLCGVGQVVVKSFNELSTTGDILREARIMAVLAETRFVPKMFGVCYGRDFRVSILQEYCAKGVTLFDVLSKYELPDQIWIRIMKQLVVGVKKIHEKGVLINDLKNDNILVDVESRNFELKFIDFGLSSYGEGRTFNITPEDRSHILHMAPEVLNGQSTTIASDIYSIGVILEDISFQSEISGLCEMIDACLGPAKGRPTCDTLLYTLEKLF